MMKLAVMVVAVLLCSAALQSDAHLDQAEPASSTGCRLHKRSALDGYTAVERSVEAVNDAAVAPRGGVCRDSDHEACAKACQKIHFKHGECCCGCDAMNLCWCQA